MLSSPEIYEFQVHQLPSLFSFASRHLGYDHMHRGIINTAQLVCQVSAALNGLQDGPLLFRLPHQAECWGQVPGGQQRVAV